MKRTMSASTAELPLRVMPFSSFCRRWVVGIILIFSASAICWAEESPPYHLATWDVEDGLPQGSVASVTQTRDGYIWIATYCGLARFDGVRFTVFDSSNTPELSSSRITSLFEDAHGTLWIAEETGELARFDPGRGFQAVPFKRNLSDQVIYAMRSDEKGDLWLITSQGLLVRPKDGVVLSPKTGGARAIVSVGTDLSSDIWVARNGAASRLRNGELEELLESGAGKAFVQGLCAAKDGGLWVTADRRVRRWKDGKFLADESPAPFGWSPTTCMLETKSGDLVLGTQNEGLYIRHANGHYTHHNRESGFSSNWVRSICEDREGNLWIGTGGNGLSVLRPGNISQLIPPDRWDGRPVLSVAATAGGELWMGTEGAGVYRYKARQWSRYGTTEGLSNLFAWSMAEDRKGNLWVGTWGGGLFVQHGERFERSTLVELDVAITAIYCDPAGVVWVGTRKGLLRCEGDNSTWMTKPDPSYSVDILAITQDKEGALWFGTSGGGLGELKDGKVSYYKRKDGLAGDYVRCIYCDRENTLWIGTLGGGISRFKQGGFSRISTEEGLPSGFISSIQEDDNGIFWLGSQAGLIRVQKESLNRFSEGNIKGIAAMIYGREEGLPTQECTSGIQGIPGSTSANPLICTSKGVVSIDTQAQTMNLLAPPVVIEGIYVDGVLRDQTAEGRLKISSGWHTLEFDYTALSFVAPSKVRFKYRLDGLNKDWVEGGGRRSANYTYIPPGAYTFEVTACNNDGVWSAQPTSVAFELLPGFFQTIWFRVLAAALLAIVVGGFVWLDARRRIRRKMHEIAQIQAVENERARIARDIHDDFGSRLTQISMLSQNAIVNRKNPTKLAMDLGEIRRGASELTHVIGEVVWAIAPHHDTLESLVTYAERFAHSFLEKAGLRCRIDIPPEIPDNVLTAEIRHNSFLAFKEAVNNAVKHARASEVFLTVMFSADACHIIIADDGEWVGGLEPNSAPFRGNGLRNMQTRMTEIGGKCTITRGPTRGTKVALEIPLQRKRPLHLL